MLFSGKQLIGSSGQKGENFETFPALSSMISELKRKFFKEYTEKYKFIITTSSYKKSCLISLGSLLTQIFVSRELATTSVQPFADYNTLSLESVILLIITAWRNEA